MSRSLFTTSLDSEDTNKLKIEHQLSYFYAEIAEAIRARMRDYPNLTDYNGVRLLSEETAQWYEGKARQSKRGISL